MVSESGRVQCSVYELARAADVVLEIEFAGVYDSAKGSDVFIRRHVHVIAAFRYCWLSGISEGRVELCGCGVCVERMYPVCRLRIVELADLQWWVCELML